LRIKEYFTPTTIEEAYSLVQDDQTTIIAGGAWLKLLPKTIEKAMDLSKLNLNQIIENDHTIEIGAMVTLEDMAQHPSLSILGNDIIPKAIYHIMGVPIRNIATIGGSIAGRFGFSDIITPLLVLNTTVVFSHIEPMSLEEYMNRKKITQDFITKIIINKADICAHFKSVKKTSNDFPILNLSVSKQDNQYRIAVGARPAGALLAHEAMAYINSQTDISEEIISQTAKLAINELAFGTNSRGSATYRTSIAEVLIRRGIEEVQGC